MLSCMSGMVCCKMLTAFSFAAFQLSLCIRYTGKQENLFENYTAAFREREFS
jgi:hypothetical protein